MVEFTKRRRGRPKKADSEKKKTVTVSLRMEKKLRDQLRVEAEKLGKSTNKEIVDRLGHTISQGGYIDNWIFGDRQNHNLMRLLGMLMRNIRNSEGPELWANRSAHEELKDAVITVLDAFGPDERGSRHDGPG